MYTCWPPVLALGVPPGMVTEADTAAPATVTDGDTAPAGAVAPEAAVVTEAPFQSQLGRSSLFHSQLEPSSPFHSQPGPSSLCPHRVRWSLRPRS